MIGIFLIYWVGKKYYDLAIIHGRSPWGFAILAVAIYYGSQFFIGVIIAIIWPEFFENMSYSEEKIINISGIPIGLGVWYLNYLYLKKKWEANGELSMEDYESEIEKIGKEEEL